MCMNQTNNNNTGTYNHALNIYSDIIYHEITKSTCIIMYMYMYMQVLGK